MAIPTVRVAELSGAEYLLDVREAHEWAAGHAAEAVFVPMSALSGRLDEVPKDADVVVVCAVGARSAQVAAYLNQNGWSARNLEGGMHAWQAAGRELVCESGTQPQVL